jgi:hypothetical protein
LPIARWGVEIAKIRAALWLFLKYGNAAFVRKPRPSSQVTPRFRYPAQLFASRNLPDGDSF